MELFSLTDKRKITEIPWQAYPIGLFLILLCLFTIFGNLLILYTIIRDSILHTAKYYYIASLAFADLLVGLIVMPFAFIFEMTHDEIFLFPSHLRVLCDSWHSIDIFASTASIFGLCVIGFDRYMTVTKPITYPNSFISKKWYYVLSFIWISSAVISFPAVIYFGTERSSISNETMPALPLVSKECDFPDNRYYNLFTSIVSFFLPLIVMIYVYIQVYSAAKRQVEAFRTGYKHFYPVKSSKSIIPKFALRRVSIEKRQNTTEAKKEISDNNTLKTSATLLKQRRPSFQLITLRIHHGSYQNPALEPLNCNNQHDNRPVNEMRRRSTRTNNFWRRISKVEKPTIFIGIVMGVFVICWLPYFVYFTLNGVFDIRLKDKQNHDLLFRILSWLGYTNSALDILVYIFTSKELRATLLKLFCKS